MIWLSKQSKKIKSGMLAYDALSQLQQDANNLNAQLQLTNNEQNIGYGFLLARYTNDVVHANDAEINKAAWDTVPNVFVLFWTFRVMVACGFYFIALFATAFYLSFKRKLHTKRWLLTLIFFSLPLPWVAAELGWVVAEYGRQPWVVDGLLPTFMGASSLSAGTVWTSIGGFVFFYTALAIVEVFLMVKYIRLGPEKLFRSVDFIIQPYKDSRAPELI